MNEKEAIKQVQAIWGDEATARLYAVPQDYGKSGRGRCTVRRPDRILVVRWFAGETFDAATALAQESEDEERACTKMRQLYGHEAGAVLKDAPEDHGDRGAGRFTVSRPGERGLLVFAGSSWDDALVRAEPPREVVEEAAAEVAVEVEATPVDMVPVETPVEVSVEEAPAVGEDPRSLTERFDVASEDGPDGEGGEVAPMSVEDVANFED